MEILRVGPQANHVKDVIGHSVSDPVYGMFATFFNWSVSLLLINVSTKFALRLSKAKPEFYPLSILPATPTK